MGLRRITRVISEHVYTFEALNGGRTEYVHSVRIILYRSTIDDGEVFREKFELGDRVDSHYEIIEKLC